jgi:hypothetical protein
VRRKVEKEERRRREGADLTSKQITDDRLDTDKTRHRLEKQPQEHLKHLERFV